jgi:hypothetical protein
MGRMQALASGARGAGGLRRPLALAGACCALLVLFGCGEPSAEELVARIDPLSETYSEDRAAVIR